MEPRSAIVTGAARGIGTQGRGGRLVAGASVAAHRGGKWQGAYSASKFGVRGLSQSVAQELAPYQITVNVYWSVDRRRWRDVVFMIKQSRKPESGEI
jgi:NAD(P)-dependent dehydrogenase (short-subunit alcohol dehydrogenase family)